MKKIFISQPMADLTNEEILKRREEAVKKLEGSMDGEEFIVIDSFFEKAPTYAKPLWFLGKSLELLSDADYVLFLDGIMQEDVGLRIYVLWSMGFRRFMRVI